MAKQSKQASYGRYLAYGVIAAGIIFAVVKLNEKEVNTVPHEWSREVDSAFVYNCVKKYSREFGQDSLKRVRAIEFCLCMLDKVKLKYEEAEMNKVTDDDIKEWDRNCRNELNYKDKIK